MAYAVAANAVCQVTFRGRLHGQVVQNQFYLQNTSGGIIGDGAAAFTTLNTQLVGLGGAYTMWRSQISVSVEDIVIDYQWISPDRFRKRTIVPLVTTGALAETEYTNTAAAFTLHGDISGPRRVFTKHLPGIPEEVVVDGLLDGGYVTDLGVMADAMIGTLPVGPNVFTWVGYGRFRAANPTHVPPLPELPELVTLLTGHTIGDTSRVMRRRTVGLGI